MVDHKHYQRLELIELEKQLTPEHADKEFKEFARIVRYFPRLEEERRYGFEYNEGLHYGADPLEVRVKHIRLYIETLSKKPFSKLKNKSK